VVFPSPVAIAAAAALPRGELRIEPLGHSPHHEAPERVLEVILAFL
jgi:pimeloyl-ACP methyl ester carboxylesterase